MVQSFPAHSRSDRAVAGDRDDTFVEALYVASGREPQCSRDGSSCVACPKRVEFVFLPGQESAEAVVLAERVEASKPPGQQLVRIGLMAGVPYHLVRRNGICRV